MRAMYLSASAVAVSTWGSISSARPLPFFTLSFSKTSHCNSTPISASSKFRKSAANWSSCHRRLATDRHRQLIIDEWCRLGLYVSIREFAVNGDILSFQKMSEHKYINVSRLVLWTSKVYWFNSIEYLRKSLTSIFFCISQCMTATCSKYGEILTVLLSTLGGSTIGKIG